jgi:hypothetical protein
MAPRSSLLARSLVLACAALAVGGCSIEPWVKPYERDHLADPIMSFDRRDHLADPIMSFDRDPVSSAYTGHVYEAREGARGATGGGGGGCGCN